MKRRFLHILSVAVLAVVTLLFAVGCGKGDETPVYVPPANPEPEPKNELIGMTVSEIAELFVGAAQRDFGGGVPLDNFKLNARFSNMSLSSSDGVFAFVLGDDEYYLAASDDMIRIIESDDSGDYSVKSELPLNVKEVGDSVGHIIASLSFAEANFSFPAISENDITVNGSECILSEEYLNSLVRAVFASSLCIKRGCLPSELTEEELEELSSSAASFTERTSLRLSAELTAKKTLTALNLELMAKDVGEYTGSEINNVSVCATLSLDSERKHLDRLIVDADYDGAKSGSLSAQIQTVFMPNGTLAKIDAKVNATVRSAVIDSESGALGSVQCGLDIYYNPLDKNVASLSLLLKSFEERTYTVYTDIKCSLGISKTDSEKMQLKLSFESSDSLKIDSVGVLDTSGDFELSLPEKVKEMIS